MNFDSTSQELKESWIEDINTLNDLEVLGQQSSRYIAVLKQLAEIEATKNGLKRDSNQDVEHTEIKQETQQDNQNKEDDPVQLPKLFTFERKLKGGIAVNGNHVELVPENVVRSEGLENGDQLDIEFNATGVGFHKFTKRSDLPAIKITSTPIVEYNHAIVERDSMLGYIVKSYYKDGNLKSLPSFFINNHDVDKFDLQEGDVIDVARMENNNYLRVRWRYNTEQVQPKNKPQKPSFYKDNDMTKNDNYSESPLNGKKVCVVGCDNYIVNFMEEADKRNAEIIHVKSDRANVIQASVSQCDVVVIPVFETSHNKMNYAKEYAKKMDIPLVILKTYGRTNFINELENIFNID